MTTKHTNQEVTDFFHDIFNPTGEDLIDVKAYGLMSQYLIQIERALDKQTMTQKELASKIGTSSSYLSQFFNLNKLINFKTLAKIELALDINFELQQSATDGIKNKSDIIQTAKNCSPIDINFPVSNDEMYAA
ncbi:hypothetical protein THERMOT_1847 [Bathymodiolus thermophilus thioautotrophic gill symbiont]|uniref:helix-turn-helix domain-containing protein n=1 Tax=Bathymodiolus thermophilus thioautotrophic gill symbiont TaxID=2360 RepID=UPI00192CCAD5|nr:helix-turn-helix transcriptional regulator [Bathymodiolus thermophilus thioautotrophic gill symbiont]CAB5503757.1 hypothetical protein THERMOT_1847 [Bathymodiolus thermophilus thioautotrophic gill symbiont]